MSHTLLIFRHAKSDFEAASDHERTLTEHGIQQAMFMGELLNEKEIHPSMVFCSSATRATQTMDLAMKAGEWECDSNIMDALYNTTPDVAISLIKQLSDDDQIVMLIGHQPTWSELANALTGESVDFNTAGMCSITFDSLWRDISESSGQLDWYECP